MSIVSPISLKTEHCSLLSLCYGVIKKQTLFFCTIPAVPKSEDDSQVDYQEAIENLIGAWKFVHLLPTEYFLEFAKAKRPELTFSQLLKLNIVIQNPQIILGSDLPESELEICLAFLQYFSEIRTLEMLQLSFNEDIHLIRRETHSTGYMSGSNIKTIRELLLCLLPKCNGLKKLKLAQLGNQEVFLAAKCCPLAEIEIGRHCFKPTYLISLPVTNLEDFCVVVLGVKYQTFNKYCETYQKIIAFPISNRDLKKAKKTASIQFQRMIKVAKPTWPNLELISFFYKNQNSHQVRMHSALALALVILQQLKKLVMRNEFDAEYIENMLGTLELSDIEICLDKLQII